ncbi:hypothetical protein NKG99_04115 [Mesorhizobium sp. M1409]|uniref:hypothetical protein n=1 Tax=Mesorhizobium sp. M1409 TaxID=2957100 RepID=UPI0033390F08
MSITAKVKYDHQEGGTVWLDIGSGAMIGASEVTMVAPHFDIGDPVIHQSGATGYIRATRALLAWVELDDMTGFATWPASDLSLITPEPVTEQAFKPEPPASPDEVEVRPATVAAAPDETPIPY